MKRVVSIYIDEELYNLINSKAIEEGIKFSNCVEKILREYFEGRKDETYIEKELEETINRIVVSLDYATKLYNQYKCVIDSYESKIKELEEKVKEYKQKLENAEFKVKLYEEKIRDASKRLVELWIEQSGIKDKIEEELAKKGFTDEVLMKYQGTFIDFCKGKVLFKLNEFGRILKEVLGFEK